MARLPDLSVRDAVMAVAGSCLVATSVTLAGITYRTLHDLILAGFDARLVAVSTATGSFIEGSEHAALLTPHHLVDLAAVPGRPYLLGLDSAQGTLVAVDLVQGGARTLAHVPADSLRRLAVEDGRILSRHARVGWVTLDTATGSWQPTGPPRDTTPESAFPSPFLGAARDPRSGQVRVLAGDPPALWSWSDGEATRIGPVRAGTDTGPVPSRAGLAFGEDGALYAAGERLVELNAADGRPSGRAFASGFRSEGQRAYQRYVRPMRTIAQAEGIRYLYTQVANAEGEVTYILDATQGEGHSLIGDPDALPEREIGPTLRVQTEGTVYVSGLKRWEGWGFLKSGYAPIVDSAGRPVAMAGADMPIGRISSRTQSALTSVVLLGVAVLLLGAAISLWISRRLTVPIQALKEGALRVAAGQLDVRVPVDGPTEVRRLAEGFNEMSATLQARIRSLREQGWALEDARLLRELDLELGDGRAAEACPGLTVTRSRASVSASGAAPSGTHAVVWLSDGETDPERALRVRATLGRLASRMADDPHGALELLEPFRAEGVHTLAVLSRDGSASVRTVRPEAVRFADGTRPAPGPAPDGVCALVSRAPLELAAGGADGVPPFRLSWAGASGEGVQP
ncbi:MAG: HAMP domain-containing protein [Gemmatimonadetes bacterium]|nr:HAMP domain-containing protein [Gemmatimonadota bacterium]